MPASSLQGHFRLRKASWHLTAWLRVESGLVEHLSLAFSRISLIIPQLFESGLTLLAGLWSRVGLGTGPTISLFLLF